MKLDRGYFVAGSNPDAGLDYDYDNAIEFQGNNGVLTATVGEKDAYVSKAMKDAEDLFDGKVNSVACIGEGTIIMGGMINMIDNINRILDRVALYLA